MKKSYAFLLMSAHYNPAVHCAQFETQRQVTYIVTVRNFEEAREKIKWFRQIGVGAVELCGAFGAEQAALLSEIAGESMAVGYVTYEEEQGRRADRFFTGFGE